MKMNNRVLHMREFIFPQQRMPCCLLDMITLGNMLAIYSVQHYDLKHKTDFVAF